MKSSIKNLFIKSNSTIREAMQTITSAAQLKLPVGITLVMDDNERLIGTVTDGDIRRALVKGLELSETVDKIMARDPITVDEDLTIDEMIKTVMIKVKESGRIRDYKVDKVILTDKDNRVVDVLNFYELVYKQEVKNKKICVLGTGHVGLPLAIAFAEAGYQVSGVDKDKDMARRLNEGEARFYEKGVQPLLKLHLREGNVKFTSYIEEKKDDVYIICVGTPVDGKTNEPVFDSIKKATSDVGSVLKKDDIIILRSTVPVGTTRNLVLPILEKKSSIKAGKDFYLAFAPERAVEGRALEEIKEIPQIIGGINKQSVQMAARVFQTINPSIIMLDSLEQAEMVKLINNAFRDLAFAFANQIALMCEKLRLDAVKIIKAANEGYPRNPVALPSPGVGGYCLTKDPYLMASVAKKIKVSADIFLEGRKTNIAMHYSVASKVIKFIHSHWPQEKKIKLYFLGFAYKGFPETSDMRCSSTLDVLNILKDKLGARLFFCGYDPIVKKEEIENLNVKYLPFEEGFKDAHCVIIMNNNPEFAKVDIFSLLEKMKKPGLLYDGWNFFLPPEIKKIKGIVYQGMGEGFN